MELFRQRTFVVLVCLTAFTLFALVPSAIVSGHAEFSPAARSTTLSTKVIRVAGNREGGWSARSGMSAYAVGLGSVQSVAVAPHGDIFFGEDFVGAKADPNCSVWVIHYRTHRVYRVAGTGPGATPFGNTPALRAHIGGCTALALGPDGLYVSDSTRGEVDRIDLETGAIRVVAGGGRCASGVGDGRLATRACLDYAAGLAVDSQGNLYISDLYNCLIRMVNKRGTISSVAGHPCPDSGRYAGDGGPARQARLNRPGGIAIGPRGNIFFADTDNSRVREIDMRTGIIRTVAGGGPRCSRSKTWSQYCGNTRIATRVLLAYPTAVAVDKQGDLFVTADDRVLRRA